jgi:hypothetical protein
MPEKKNFVLRVNNDIYKALEKWASDEFRSVNGQIEYLLHEALKHVGRLPKQEDKNKKETSNKGT